MQGFRPIFSASHPPYDTTAEPHRPPSAPVFWRPRDASSCTTAQDGCSFLSAQAMFTESSRNSTQRFGAPFLPSRAPSQFGAEWWAQEGSATAISTDAFEEAVVNPGVQGVLSLCRVRDEDCGVNQEWGCEPRYCERPCTNMSVPPPETRFGFLRPTPSFCHHGSSSLPPREHASASPAFYHATHPYDPSPFVEEEDELQGAAEKEEAGEGADFCVIRAASRSALSLPLGSSPSCQHRRGFPSHPRGSTPSVKAQDAVPSFSPDYTHRSYAVAAVIHSGSRSREVGVAVCHFPCLSLSLSQYSDGIGYGKSLSLLSNRDPVEVIVPLSAARTHFCQTLLQNLDEEITFTGVPRALFQAERGVCRLLELQSDPSASFSLSASSFKEGGTERVVTAQFFEEASDRYLCVSAAHALLCYLESVHGFHFLPRSLSIRYFFLESFVDIPRAAARGLHITPWLPSSVLEKQAAAGRGKSVQQNACLMHALPRATTIMGQRFLRGSILQPLTSKVAIEQRYDVVGWLVAEPHRLYVLRQVLEPLQRIDLDRLSAELCVAKTNLDPPNSSREEAAWGAATDLASFSHHRARVQLVLDYWDAVKAGVEMHGALRTLLNACQRTEDTPSASSDTRPPLLQTILSVLEMCKLEELITLLNMYVDAGVQSRTTVLAQEGKQQKMTVTKQREDGFSTNWRGRASVSKPVTKTARAAKPEGGIYSLLRLSFVMKAGPDVGGSTPSRLLLERQRLSRLLEEMNAYAESIRRDFGLHSLRLEADRLTGACLRIYRFSYSAAEKEKARRAPLTHAVESGASHVAASLSLWGDHYDHSLNKEENEVEKGDPDAWECGFRDSRLVFMSSPSHAEGPSCASREVGAASFASRASTAPTSAASCGRSSFASSTSTKRQQNRRIRCSSEPLDLLNAKAAECLRSIIKEEVRIASRLLQALQRCVGRLQALGECVSLLDMLITFAVYASANQCQRPVLVEDPVEGCSHTLPRLCFEEARYPSFTTATTNSSAKAKISVPNTVEWREDERVLIITGPNHSGKSTLLREVGQLQALAQCGCFIPVSSPTPHSASSTQIPLVSRILAHTICDDAPSVTRSSFKGELTALGELTTAVVGSACTTDTHSANRKPNSSLVLLDEIGRSTNVKEGFALLWATVLFLLELGKREGFGACRVMLTTHFPGITALEKQFPHWVGNRHFSLRHTLRQALPMGPEPKGEEDGRATSRLRHDEVSRSQHAHQAVANKRTMHVWSHRLLPGPCEDFEGHYGLELARSLQLLPSVVDGAFMLSELESHAAGFLQKEAEEGASLPVTKDVTELPDEQACESEEGVEKAAGSGCECISSEGISDGGIAASAVVA